MNVNSRRTARISQYESQQHSAGMPATTAELTTRTLTTSLVDSGRNNRNITDINSRRETLNSRDANNSRDTNYCISINREANSNRDATNSGCQQLMSFCRKSAKKPIRTAKNL